MKKLINCILIITLSLSLFGCGQGEENLSSIPASSQEPDQESDNIAYQFSDSGFENAPIKGTADFYAMDTVMSLLVYADSEAEAKSALAAGADEIYRIDNEFSTNKEKSQIYQLNHKGHGQLDADGQHLMKRSVDFYKKTDGIFNIAIYPVVKAWGFTTSQFHVPERSALAETLAVCSLDKLDWNEKTGEVRFQEKGMGIDFGAIAKGYASGRLMDVFREHGIESALCSLGGNVQLLNEKPDGSDYRVAIQNPENPDSDYAGSVTATNEAVITSGDYQRFFEKDGKRYHHIIDPRNGYPADNGLSSVTIISEDGTLADALATSFFILGKEKSVELWKNAEEPYEMILIGKDGTVSVSEGLVDRYQPLSLGQPDILHK